MLNDLSHNLSVVVTLNVILAVASLKSKNKAGDLMGLYFIVLLFFQLMTHTVEADHDSIVLWYTGYTVVAFAFALTAAKMGLELQSWLLTASMCWLVIMSINAVYDTSNQLSSIHFVVIVTLGAMQAGSTYSCTEA